MLVYMLTGLGYIDGIHGAPYIAAPWILYGKCHGKCNGTTRRQHMHFRLVILIVDPSCTIETPTMHPTRSGNHSEVSSASFHPELVAPFVLLKGAIRGIVTELDAQWPSDVSFQKHINMNRYNNRKRWYIDSI